MKIMRKRIRMNSLEFQECRILQQGRVCKNGYYFINREKRCYLIWNLYNPNALIFAGAGYAIHHKNEIKNDDRIENLMKMTLGEHMRLHSRGNTHGLGKKRLEETRKKLSLARKGEKHPMFGKHHSKETRKKLSLANKGMKLSEETRKKISFAQKGEKNPRGMLGKYHLEETRKKISDGNRGKVVLEESRKKMSKAKKGRKHSEEHRRNMSLALKGEKHPMFGKYHSKETRKKMSDAKRLLRRISLNKCSNPL